MLRTKRQRVLALGAAVASIAVVASLGSMGPSQATTTADVQFEPIGYLAIETYSDGTGRVVRYDTADVQIGNAVSLGVTKASKCRATNLDAVGALLGISVGDPIETNESVGLVSNGLGVRTKNTCSTDSGRVSPGQTIELTLDATTIGGNVRFDYAELDIEGKQNALVSYLINRRDGGDGSGTLQLESTKASDNGPDAGAGDNSRETVGVVDDPADDFRTIVLTATTDSGQFSLEGGGDYGDASVLAQSTKLFLVAQNFGVDCGETVDVDFGDGAASSAIYTRGPQDPNKPECVEIPVTLIQDATGVLLEVDDPHSLGSTITINWVVERYDGATLRSAASINDELEREINFAPGVGTFELVQWCSNDVPVGFPAGTPWCMTSDVQTLSGNQILQSQTYQGQGDPYWR